MIETDNAFGETQSITLVFLVTQQPRPVGHHEPYIICRSLSPARLLLGNVRRVFDTEERAVAYAKLISDEHPEEEFFVSRWLVIDYEVTEV